MEMRLNKIIILVVPLILISCKGDAHKNNVFRKSVTVENNTINYFDKRYVNIHFSLIID